MALPAEKLDNADSMQETVAAENAHGAGNPMRPLRQGVARAAFASGLAEAATRVLTIVLSIATARALLPGQVGVLGLAVIAIGIVSLVAACSETAGVIGRYAGTDSHHAIAATAVRGLILACLLASGYLCLGVITRLLAGAEGAESELSRLLRILLWVPVLELAACYPRVLLQRRLDLTYLAGATLLQVAVHVGLSVTLLWQGFGAIGVVWSSVVAAGLAAICVWLRLLGPRRPRWSGMPDRRLRRNVLAGTSRVFAGGFVGYLNGRIDNLLVSGAIGPTAMGFYGMAWSASRIAPQILGQALGFVLVPALAQIQTDEERVGRALRESIRHSYLLLAPLAAALFVSAPSLVLVVLGPKWLPMVPCLRVMSITILGGPVTTAASALLLATGRAHIAGLATIGQLAVLATLIVPFSRALGIVGAAYVDLLAVAALTVSFLAVSPLFRRTLKQGVFASIVVPMIAALLAGTVAWAVSTQVAAAGIRLALQGSALILGYPVILSVFGGKAALLDFVALLWQVVRRAGTAPDVSPAGT